MLPSTWCPEEKERTVSFHNLEEFVKEADLANDPVFSPEVLKSNKNKAPDRSQVKRSQGANRFASFSSRTLPSESRGRPNAKQEPKQQSLCVFWGSNHAPHKCGELSGKSIDERLALVRLKGLCFGCLKRGHQSKNCRARLNCENAVGSIQLHFMTLRTKKDLATRILLNQLVTTMSPSWSIW